MKGALAASPYLAARTIIDTATRGAPRASPLIWQNLKRASYAARAARTRMQRLAHRAPSRHQRQRLLPPAKGQASDQGPRWHNARWRGRYQRTALRGACDIALFLCGCNI